MAILFLAVVVALAVANTDGAPAAAASAVSCKWKVTPNMNNGVGNPYAPATSLALCESTCTGMKGCASFDWYAKKPKGQQCVLWGNQSGKKTVAASLAVTHYDLTCTGKVPTLKPGAPTAVPAPAPAPSGGGGGSGGQHFVPAVLNGAVDTALNLAKIEAAKLGTIVSVAGTAVGGASKALGIAGNVVGQAGGAAVSGANKVLGDLSSGNILNGVIDTAATGLNVGGDVLNGAVQLGGDVVNTAVQGVSDVAQGAGAVVNAGVNAVSGAVQDVSNVAQGLSNDVGSLFNWG